MTRCALYTRISEADDRERVEDQEADLREAASRRGATIVAAFEDNDITGSGDKVRPDFDRLVALIEAGGVDVVMARDLARFARGLAPYARFVEVCQKARITVAWRGGEANFATGEGIAALEYLSVGAREFLRELRANTKRALRSSAAKGRPHGGMQAYGFERDGVTIIEAEAEVLRVAARAVISGVSLSRAAAATPFSPGRLGSLLLSPRLAGHRVHLGEIAKRNAWPFILTDDQQTLLRATTRRATREPRRT